MPKTGLGAYLHHCLEVVLGAFSLTIHLSFSKDQGLLFKYNTSDGQILMVSPAVPPYA